MDYLFLAVCLVVIGFLVGLIRKNLRRLNQRIEQFREEQARHPLDFQTALAELSRLFKSKAP